MKLLATTVLTTAGLLIAGTVFATKGDVVRTDYSSPYYLGGVSRLAFPDDTTVRSWGSPAATTVDESIISQWRVGGVVPIRQGYSLVKFGTDPAVYAVSPGAVLHQITSESLAAKLYGPAWQDRIVNLYYSFWPNYTIGASVSDATYSDGTLFKYAGKPTVYYLSNGVMHPFQSEAAFHANQFSFGAVITVPDTAKYVVGNAITGYEQDLNGLSIQ